MMKLPTYLPLFVTALGFLAAPILLRADDPDTRVIRPVLARVDTIAADVTAPAIDPSAQRGNAAQPPITAPHLFPLKFGMDTYAGISTRAGFRHVTDGMWAGNSVGDPSVAYLAWNGGAGRVAKLSIGTGRMSNGGEAAVDQPTEAWWQAPAGKSSLTVGKFWVPFASQEWLSESRPGAMLQWSRGPDSIALSTNYNTRMRAVNAYFRVGRSLTTDTAVGVSLAYGSGLTCNSVHDRAWAVDATAAVAGCRLSGEYMGALRGRRDRFGFLFGKAEYENLGLWKPFVSFYQWNDRSGGFGRFRSAVFGLTFRATPLLAIEGAVAPTSDRRVSWLQLHWAWER